MTEQEWLAGDDPMRMLGMHSGPDHRPWSRPKHMEGVSDRKLRLFACASSRLHPKSEEAKAFGDGHIAKSLAACDVAEQWADGELSRDEAKRLEGNCWIVMSDLPHVAARLMADYPRRTALTASLLREIVGNPWRLTRYGEWTNPNNAKGESRFIHDEPMRSWLTHADGRVPKLAQVIYDERRWSAMPILADALEESGCDDEAILRHLRRPNDCRACDNTGIGTDEYGGTSVIIGGCPRCGGDAGPHVRGCWVIDLLLGKE